MSAPTKILYIRNFPETLFQKAKSSAALQGVTLTKWIVDLVKKAVNS